MFDSMVPHILGYLRTSNNNLPDDYPDKGLASMLIYGTSGLKPKVKVKSQFDTPQ